MRCFSYAVQSVIDTGMIIGLLSFSINAVAAEERAITIPAFPASCEGNYYQHQPPRILTQKLATNLIPLCFDGFAIMYSGMSRTALWSAEYLTRDRVNQSSTLERVDNFHPESRLPDNLQAQLADYSRSGYDRGHLSPNGDMATVTQQYDSFSLANIVPQNPQNNRNLWRDIESQTRSLAVKYGEVYVVTGVAFTGDNIQQLNGRILIPTFMYKAIYLPSIQQAGVYYAPNDASQRVEVISLAELSQRTHINALPTLADTIQATPMNLPTTHIGSGVTSTNKSPTNPTSNPKSTEASTPDHVTNVILNLFISLIKWLIGLIK